MAKFTTTAATLAATALVLAILPMSLAELEGSGAQQKELLSVSIPRPLRSLLQNSTGNGTTPVSESKQRALGMLWLLLCVFIAVLLILLLKFLAKGCKPQPRGAAPVANAPAVQLATRAAQPAAPAGTSVGAARTRPLRQASKARTGIAASVHADSNGLGQASASQWNGHQPPAGQQSDAVVATASDQYTGTELRTCSIMQLRAEAQAEQCAVCLDEYYGYESVKQLKCGHFFHPGCIDAWLARHAQCPMCNQQVTMAY